MVGVGDRADDREAETEPVTVGAAAVESLERLEEPVELGRRDRRAGVRDSEQRATVAGLGREADAAVLDVVLDRVAEEVGDEALDEAWIAGRVRRVDRDVECEAIVI